MMSAVMAIALICGSRFDQLSVEKREAKQNACVEIFLSCYQIQTGDLDTRLIKCIRKGN